ncbi:hypothetical protein [Clostridium ganghwense]|uniref:WD40 repeat domain-containing protein n=1 Tax=Clostridium ganghwense TaxID=312089 RepID=A0ABT4CRI6_9CLOT|nr:hypothetical protein [Clostridium ganghwense]MCY6371649.1 hypothetical protein [Clostridium ganghwense]
MKKSTKLTALKISIPAVLIGGCIGINYLFNTKVSATADKSVIVCEDASQLQISDDKPLQIVQRQKNGNIDGLHEIFGFNENQAIVGIGLNKKQFEQKYKDKKRTEMSDEEHDEAYNDINGELYKLNLSTLEKTPLKNGKYIVDAEAVSAGFSPDKMKFEYTFNNKQYIYDVKKGTSRKYHDKSMCGNWSEDGDFIINGRAFGSNESSNNLYIYDVKNNMTKKICIDDKVFLYATPSFYSKDGKEIYFLGEQSKEDNLSIRIKGVFKINIDTKKVEPVMLLPYLNNKKGSRRNKNRIYDDYNLIDGEKKIIFEGRLNEEDGVFIYDIQNKKNYKVISATEKGFGVSYWLSPDKSKLIYATPEDKGNKRFWNLYAAKISENKLINRICLGKCIDLGGSIPNMVHWSSDSKKIVFFEENDEYNKNGFNVSDRNIINVITFK